MCRVGYAGPCRWVAECLVVVDCHKSDDSESSSNSIENGHPLEPDGRKGGVERPRESFFGDRNVYRSWSEAMTFFVEKR